jgi:hypothetical protein
MLQQTIEIEEDFGMPSILYRLNMNFLGVSLVILMLSWEHMSIEEEYLLLDYLLKNFKTGLTPLILFICLLEEWNSLGIMVEGEIDILNEDLIELFAINHGWIYVVYLLLQLLLKSYLIIFLFYLSFKLPLVLKYLNSNS